MEYCSRRTGAQGARTADISARGAIHSSISAGDSHHTQCRRLRDSLTFARLASWHCFASLCRKNTTQCLLRTGGQEREVMKQRLLFPFEEIVNTANRICDEPGLVPCGIRTLAFELSR